MNDELFSIPQLSALAQKDRRWVERKLARVPSERKGKAVCFRLRDALPALLADSEASEIERQILLNRQREQRAVADIREIELADRMREVVLRSDVRALWEDGFAKIASIIRSARYITNEQRKSLFGEIAAVKLDSLPEGGER